MESKTVLETKIYMPVWASLAQRRKQGLTDTARHLVDVFFYGEQIYSGEWRREREWFMSCEERQM